MSFEEFLDLGKQPLANAFSDEPANRKTYRYDLRVGIDTDTKLVSLVSQPNKEDMFNKTYPYRAGTSQTFTNNLAELADICNINLAYKRFPKFLEIGSNDGTLLKNISKDATIKSIEPCLNFATELMEQGYTVIPEFFSKDLFDSYQEFDVIVSTNCFCHIKDIRTAFEDVASLLSKDGIFIMEDPSLMYVLRKGSYDQFYDEHAHIFSITALNNLLKEVGLGISAVQYLPDIHGGSHRVFVRKTMYNFIDHILKIEDKLGINDYETYSNFAYKVYDKAEEMKKFFNSLKNPIIAMGATSKSTTVYNFLGLTSKHIKYVSDTTPVKWNKYMPGTDIPIVPQKSVSPDKYEKVFLGAWNFRKEIESAFPNKQYITHLWEE